jgi:hypothetical protein
MGLDAGTYRCHPRRPQAILFRRPHCDHLPAALDECRQRLGLLVRQRARGRGRMHGLAEMGQRLRIEPIGLGQAPGGAGEVADLTRIDHGDRQADDSQLRHQCGLVAPGGLDHNHLRLECLQPPHDFGDPSRIIG